MAVAELLMVDPKVLILIGAFLVALAAFGLSNRFGR
jgi:multisubunit Na+/H+ antiporter MnhG subunit